MSSNTNNGRSGGITFAGALTLLFIGLKLGHAIDWSWWWVFAPSWAPAAAIIGVSILVIGGAAVVRAISATIKGSSGAGR